MRVLVDWVYGKHSLLPDASCSPLTRQRSTALVAEGTKGDCSLLSIARALTEP